MHRQSFRFWSLMTVLLVSCVVAGPLACSTASPLEDMEYADQAEYLYQQGADALERGRYFEATETFNTVRNEYPYSRWAALANLGIADAYYAQDQYASAVQQYRGFIDLYPRHQKIEYAHWRVALAFYEQMPSDFFILPPAYERDLSTTRDAVRELQIFMRNFEDSEYADEAHQKWREAMHRLASHEYYVAQYYMDADNPRGAAQRLRYLLQNFTGLGFDAEALFMLGEAYYQLQQPDLASTVWNDLIEHHPDHDRAGDASDRLQKL